jgi:hypothetical protein
MASAIIFFKCFFRQSEEAWQHGPEALRPVDQQLQCGSGIDFIKIVSAQNFLSQFVSSNFGQISSPK